MNPQSMFRLSAVATVVASGALLSAQVLLPSSPTGAFGGSVTAAYDGWFENADGTNSFLVGYYSRNSEAAIDVPIGPNNHFEPGDADMGQPTHFLPGRNYGMFTFTMPKDYGSGPRKISWVITANGVRTSIPFNTLVEYNVSPHESSEGAADGGFNLPPVLRFSPTGENFKGPLANLGTTLSRTATVGAPMALDFWADDDAKYSSGGGGPRRGTDPPVSLALSKYRGPGDVTFDSASPELEATKGGEPSEPYSGKGSTTVAFSQPGDYMLHVTANDYSGHGGGGSGCCWTTAIIKVAVKDGPRTTGDGQ